MHLGAVQQGEKAVVIDDVVATGGTLSAAIKLLERMGAEVVECACVIGLPDLKGKGRLNGKPLYLLVEPRFSLVEECTNSQICKNVCKLGDGGDHRP
ncbi:adenine phosphoribosyltransferase 5-like [Olea europaea var. sylvestris]|uniref:adenine phosphoribosyltransferase 5-like n=1 Tax=Olea europaea var. sylvestris TaxID=158386 RepID=UPI000C1D3B86|nr:adenine phosphoribosyltransferase 5-like [Olea europaea var. sylvestris]